MSTAPAGTSIFRYKPSENVRIRELHADVTVLVGDVMNALPLMHAKRAQCIVTSPPYWGLRDYGIPNTSWPEISFRPMVGVPSVKIPAWTGALGLEPTPMMYIAHIIHVVRHLKRVLSDDGIMWLNLGDCYASAGTSEDEARRRRDADRYANGPGDGNGLTSWGSRAQGRSNTLASGFKRKDRVGLSWMIALGIQGDGWWLRRDIIWDKTNTTPESAKDRPTTAHEYVFQFTKSANYYYDAEAIEEAAADSSIQRWSQNVDEQIGSNRQPGKTNGPLKAVGGPRRKSNGLGSRFNVDRVPTPRKVQPSRGSSNRSPESPVIHGNRPGRSDAGYAHNRPDQTKRNKRSVWHVATSAYSEAHFATFPPALIEPCILAGSRPGDIVLDPFGGSGTTGGVALRHGRKSVLIEIKDEYVALMPDRIDSITDRRLQGTLPL